METTREIGSHFWPEALQEAENGLEQLFAGDVIHMMSGRCALCYVLDDIASRKSTQRTAYLPAYTCASTVEPFLKKGCRVRFYDVDDSFRPVLDERTLREASVLFLEGYFGFPNHDSTIVSSFRARGGTVIHDVTHTVFSRDGVCLEADYLVASLRKWFGIPAGGAAVSRYGSFRRTPAPADDTYIMMRKEAMAAKRSYIETGNAANKPGMLLRFSEAEARLREIYDTQAADDASVRIAQHFPVEAMVRARRKNYAGLIETIRGAEDVLPAYPALVDGVTPLFLPVLSGKRDALRGRLIESGVYTPIHWPVPDVVAADGFPVTSRIAATILSLPCDQRYTLNDMKRIGELLNAQCD